MNKDNDFIELLPNASIFIESMRSIGYSFETAIADIIDNSISANATRIDLFQRIKNENPYIQIIDNGDGMDNAELLEALRIGSKDPKEKRSQNDLGRFGLGLKSASFSQCRKLTVISKKNNKFQSYQWDLDLVAKSNKFEVRRLTNKEILEIDNIEFLKKYNSGTIVQWEEFDRISSVANNLQNEITDLMNEAIDHISLIFHRFIQKKLDMYVNYQIIQAKDPFLVTHSGTQERPEKKITLENDIIILKPFVLPHFSRLSEKDKRQAGKISDQYKMQGFYLYRNKRLIVWGDYLGLNRKSELAKNLRIQIDIPNSLDHLWQIDIKKSRATIPSKIKKNLISSINDGEEISKRVNVHKGTKEITNNKTIWQFYSKKEAGFYFNVNKENEIYKNLVSILSEQQFRIFEVFVKTLSENIPFQRIYSEIANGYDKYTVHDDEFIAELEILLQEIKENTSLDYKTFLESMLSIEPYISSEKAIIIIRKRLEEYGESKVKGELNYA